MDSQRVTELIQRLQAQTKLGKLRWSKTADRDTFILGFPDYTIQIGPTQTGNDLGSSYDLAAQQLGISNPAIRIFNSDDVLVDQISGYSYLAGTQSSDYKLKGFLSDLYMLARAQALGADQAIDAILAQLEA